MLIINIIFYNENKCRNKFVINSLLIACKEYILSAVEIIQALSPGISWYFIGSL
jgi:hypothetical protein